MKVTKKNVASKYRVGNQWVVSHYAPQYDMWEESRSMDFYSACRAVGRYRDYWDTKTQSYKEGV